MWGDPLTHPVYSVCCSYEDATCMVTIGEGKFFSLGLDLGWITGLNSHQLVEFVRNSQKLLARILTFPLVTVAALNGEKPS